MRSMRHGIVGLAMVMLLATAAAGCGRVGGRVAQTAANRARARIASVLARDAARDRVTPAVVLQRERRVFRYTTFATAKREAEKGLQTGTHLASRATPGRPLRGDTAARRYGLPRTPQLRETVTLPKGTAVRFNKALGGGSGVGEISLTAPLPPDAVKKSVRLPSSR